MSHTDDTSRLEHGKIGDRIAVVRNGKQIYKKLYKPSNPQTPQQQKHRAKLAFANRLSKALAEAVNRGFIMASEGDSGLTPRNAFVKTNWNNGAFVWDDEKKAWEVNPVHLKLAEGPLFIDYQATATIQDNMLHIIIPDTGVHNQHASAEDKLFVVLYCPATEKLVLHLGPERKDCGEQWYKLKEGLVGKDGPTWVYIWFQAFNYHRESEDNVAIFQGQASRSHFLGAF